MSKNLLYFWLILAMLFWGASWPIATVLSNYLTVHEFISYRYLFTTLSLLPVIWWMKLSFKINWHNFLIASIVAILLIFYSKFYFLSAQHGTPGLSGAVVTTLMPIIVYLLLLLFSKHKKPTTKDFFALLLGIIGVSTTMNIWNFDLDKLLSTNNSYLIIAATFWALLSIVTTYAKSITPVVFSFYIYLMVTIFDFIFFFESVHSLIFMTDNIFWINFLFITIGSTTFATTIYFLSAQKLGSKNVSVFTFLVPFFALALSAILIHEPLQWTTILGAIITVTALIILNNNQSTFK